MQTSTDKKKISPSEAIIHRGKKLFTMFNFNLDDPIRKEIYRKVWYGITGDKHYYSADVDPSKSILLYGPNLIGKTVLFQVLQEIFSSTPVRFASISPLRLRKMIEGTKQRQMTIKEIFDTYGNGKRMDLYIDDIAYKYDEGGIWKEVRDIISDIIHERCNLFASENYKTYISSDIIPCNSEAKTKGQPTLQAIYGERTFSRIQMLTNFIEWKI